MATLPCGIFYVVLCHTKPENGLLHLCNTDYEDAEDSLQCSLRLIAIFAFKYVLYFYAMPGVNGVVINLISGRLYRG